MILIGSRANYYYDKTVNRVNEETDWDVIMTKDNMIKILTKIDNIVEVKKHDKYKKYKVIMEYDKEKGKKKRYKWEIELVEEKNSNTLIEEYCKQSKKEIKIEDMKIRIAPIEILYIIKKSHLHHDLKWEKHMEDFMKLKNKMGKKRIKEIEEKREIKEIFNLRRKEIDERRIQPKINLNVSNDEFFENSEKYIGRIVNHDTIHEYVKYNEEPLYKKFKKDKNKALIDKNLFFLSSYKDRLNCVREEAMSLTIERYLLNKKTSTSMGNNIFYKQSYKHITKKLATTLTKGFFRDFVIDNYSKICECPLDLEKITRQIKRDLGEKITTNIFELDDVFSFIFAYIRTPDIINLCYVNKMFYHKLNSSFFKNLYINHTIGTDIKIPFHYKYIYYFSRKNSYHQHSFIKFDNFVNLNPIYNSKLLLEVFDLYKLSSIDNLLFLSHPLSILNDSSLFDFIPALSDYKSFNSIYSVYLPSLYKAHCFILIDDDLHSDNEESWEDSSNSNTHHTLNYSSKLRFIFSKSSYLDIYLDCKYSTNSHDCPSDSLSFYHTFYNIDNLNMSSSVTTYCSLFPPIYLSVFNKLIFYYLHKIHTHFTIYDSIFSKLFP